MQQKNPGYDDTPVIPGSRFKVHDSSRPQPRIVRPGSASTQEAPGAPPSDAILLFDGSDLSQWTAADGGEARWNVADGCMEVAPRTGDIKTRAEFGDCQLHLEWAAPTEVKGESQGRGNSGVFMGAVKLSSAVVGSAPGDALSRPARVCTLRRPPCRPFREPGAASEPQRSLDSPQAAPVMSSRGRYPAHARCTFRN